MRIKRASAGEQLRGVRKLRLIDGKHPEAVYRIREVGIDGESPLVVRLRFCRSGLGAEDVGPVCPGARVVRVDRGGAVGGRAGAREISGGRIEGRKMILRVGKPGIEGGRTARLGEGLALQASLGESRRQLVCKRGIAGRLQRRNLQEPDRLVALPGAAQQ